MWLGGAAANVALMYIDLFVPPFHWYDSLLGVTNGVFALVCTVFAVI